MSSPKFAETHNVVAFLEKPEESDGFAEIIDFLKASSVSYALTVNPVIYTSCIEQFWATAKVQTVNGVRQIQALVDKKRVIVTESSIRRDLHLDDAEGTDCLPTATIFEELARMGYEKPSQKLTFYKAFFSPQWKYFIHTITQCLSAKSTAWNEFSSSMASLIICLATNQKFNLSKYIFDAMKDKPSKKAQRQEVEVPQDEAKHEKSVPTPSNDPQPSGEDSMQLTELMRLERRKMSRPTGLKRLSKVGMSRRVESSEDQESLGAPEDASKQGRIIEDIDADVDVSLVDENQERQNDDLMFDSRVLEVDVMHVEAKVDRKDEQSKKPGDSTAGEQLLLLVLMIMLFLQLMRKSLWLKHLYRLKQLSLKLYTKLTMLLTPITTTRPRQKLAQNTRREANIALIESWKLTQAKMEADRLLLRTPKSKEKRIDKMKEKAKLFMELMEKRRKHFATLRAQEKLNRPPTKA
ncbi:hypothetical protein Tco_0238208 [Tanacetum coccineum]